MKRYSGINTRYFAMKENLAKLEEEHLKYSTGLLCVRIDHIAKAEQAKAQIKRLKRRMRRVLLNQDL